MWQFAPCVWSKCHESRNEFRIDPIRLGACATAGSEGFDLSWRQLPSRDTGCIQRGPQTPFLPSSRLETNKRVR